jgi:hypothetical protein
LGYALQAVPTLWSLPTCHTNSLMMQNPNTDTHYAGVETCTLDIQDRSRHLLGPSFEPQT